MQQRKFCGNLTQAKKREETRKEGMRETENKGRKHKGIQEYQYHCNYEVKSLTRIYGKVPTKLTNLWEGHYIPDPYKK